LILTTYCGGPLNPQGGRIGRNWYRGRRAPREGPHRPVPEARGSRTSGRGPRRAPASSYRLSNPGEELAYRAIRDRPGRHAPRRGHLRRGQDASARPAVRLRSHHPGPASEHQQGCRCLDARKPRSRKLISIRSHRRDVARRTRAAAQLHPWRVRRPRSLTLFARSSPTPDRSSLTPGGGTGTFASPQARGAGARESRQDREGSSGKRARVATVRLGYPSSPVHGPPASAASRARSLCFRGRLR
jgi:hypothetical protein